MADNPTPNPTLEDQKDSDDEAGVPEPSSPKVGEVMSDIIHQLSLLSVDELDEVMTGIKRAVKEKKKVVAPTLLCVCGTRLVGQFKELGKCRGCRDIDAANSNYQASQKCRDYWKNRGGREGNKDDDEGAAK